ncbi:MAG TPA: WYL domain-containing protein [Mycobacteriales bacterium]|jgi:proteasome accessory factor C|nr:WYL domain-containing protein [Mycobacteriales bacterium]
MAAAGDQLPRLLALVPWLLAHPGERVTDVAAEFGVTPTRLEADLNLLFVCGLPGHGPGDLIDVVYEGDRVSVHNADAISRPLRLTADEALALVVALRTLAEVPGVDASDAVRRALAKVESAVGGEAGPAGRVAVAVESEADVVSVATRGLEERRRIHLTYYVPGRDETTERDVDPMRLVLAGGRTYLEAWCRRVEDVRLFRLDRVLDLTLLDVPAEVPAEARPHDFSAGVFTAAPDDLLVTLELAAAARWVADYYPCESVEELPDGGLRVALRTPDTGWVRRLLLRLGAHGRVAAPDELAAQVRADAADALAAYDGG